MNSEILVATRKGLFSAEAGPKGTWQLREAGFMGSNVSQVLTDPRDGARYAALNHGHFGVKLHRSDDGGKNWQEITTPAYPEGEPATVPVHFGEPIKPSVSLIWALEAGGDDQPGRLWCGTIPGGLFRSDDRGATWHLVRSLWDHPGRKEWFGGGADLPGIHSILLDPRDSNRIILGVSCGGVWVSADGGETWACRAQGMRAAYMPPERAFDPGIQDPHRVVLCRARPDTMWAQHHNGIFRTDNGGESWREISAQPSSFGFAVAVHPDDPDTARFAYDLTFRHALDIDRTGERLAFGTTTGSLWVSPDRGESWVTVSEHLPPVYAVRFVAA